jgi:(2Fe-2S) ferredoxin
MVKTRNEMSKLTKKIEKIGILEAKRHLFFCIGPDCCQKEEGTRLWDHAKKATKDLSNPVLRTKAGCLRICCHGPWLVVYPGGVWYPKMTPEKLDRVLREHVEGGTPVQEWVAATNPLDE